jgi:hypothetical protein
MCDRVHPHVATVVFDWIRSADMIVVKIFERGHSYTEALSLTCDTYAQVDEIATVFEKYGDGLTIKTEKVDDAPKKSSKK